VPGLRDLRAVLDAYIQVDDVDALHAEYAAKGIEFTLELGDTP
jgi:hypothetical protein